MYQIHKDRFHDFKDDKARWLLRFMINTAIPVVIAMVSMITQLRMNALTCSELSPRDIGIDLRNGRRSSQGGCSIRGSEKQ